MGRAEHAWKALDEVKAGGVMDFRQWAEASRWKSSNWVPPPKNTLQSLARYKIGDYYASFTDLSGKLGINPNPINNPKSSDLDANPFGIYAYPIGYLFSTNLKDLYATDKPYVWIFKPKNPQRILHIMKAGDKAYEAWFDGMSNMGGSSGFEVGPANTWFRNQNIDGFVDHGTGTIQENEPTQAVFFGSNVIIPIEVINNYND